MDDSDAGADGDTHMGSARRAGGPRGVQLEYLRDFKKEKLVTKPGTGTKRVPKIEAFTIPPPDPIAMRHSMSPKDFYFPWLYVWAPFEVDSSFSPFCAHCSSTNVSLSGWSGFRRVLDTDKVRYAITRRYICNRESCSRTFLAWDDRILALAPAHILFAFPIIFTHRLGVTQAVFDLMRSFLEAGTGPGPFTKVIEEHHWRRYDRCRVAYMARISALRRPRSGQTTLLAGELAEEPPVFSAFDDPDGYGGIRISRTYLRKVYSLCMGKLEAFMKRRSAMVPAKILSGDHFFKILKCNFTFGGSRSFEAAYSLVNEHSEVIAVVLTQSKSLEDIRGMLTGVAKRMVALGLPKNNISLFYTDNPAAEKTFLHSIFEGLQFNTSEQARLPVFSLPVGHTVLAIPAPGTTANANKIVCDVNNGVRQMNNELEAIAAEGKTPFVGLDSEWTVLSRSRHGQQVNTEVLQLSTETMTLVIQVSRSGIPHELKRLLSNPRVLKVGRSISADVKRLQKKWPDLVVVNIKDVAAYGKELGLVARANISLKDMCEELLHVTLDKTEQVGQWGGNLSGEQIMYAAKDAHACWSLYTTMLNCGSRFVNAGDLTDGAQANVMDATGTDRVATATISSLQPAAGRRASAHKRPVRVNFVKVLVPSYVLPLSQTAEPTTLGMLWHEAEQGGRPASFLVQCRHLRDANHPMELHDARRQETRPRVPSLATGDGVFDAREEVSLDRANLQALVSAGGTDTWDDDEAGALEGEEDDMLGTLEEDDDIVEQDVEMTDPTDWERSGVKADPMHVMDRILRLLSKKHGALGLFSRRLSQSIMLSNLKDALAAKVVAAKKWPDTPWAEVLFRRSRWLNKRVRRFIPPPDVLVDRLNAVFAEFQGVVDATTGSPLFTPQAVKAFKAVLKLAESGAVSDRPGMPLYVVLARDQDELPLWLCSRGTNMNEGGVHQKLVKNFLSMKGASPELVQFALLECVHRSNVRAAARTRGAPFPGHYDTWLVDEVCKLEEELYGRRISFPTWQCADDYSLPEFCCGVMPMETSELSKLGLPVGEQLQMALTVVPRISLQKRWLAREMRSQVPLLPVHTIEDIKLYHESHKRLVAIKKEELSKAFAPGEVPVLSTADCEPSLQELTVAINAAVTVAWLDVARRLALANERPDATRSALAASPLPVFVDMPKVYFKTIDQVRMYQAKFERSSNVMSTLVVHSTALRRDTVAAGESYRSFGTRAGAMAAVHPRRAVGAPASRAGGGVTAIAIGSGGAAPAVGGTAAAPVAGDAVGPAGGVGAASVADVEYSADHAGLPSGAETPSVAWAPPPSPAACPPPGPAAWAPPPGPATRAPRPSPADWAPPPRPASWPTPPSPATWPTPPPPSPAAWAPPATGDAGAQPPCTLPTSPVPRATQQRAVHPAPAAPAPSFGVGLPLPPAPALLPLSRLPAWAPGAVASSVGTTPSPSVWQFAPAVPLTRSSPSMSLPASLPIAVAGQPAGAHASTPYTNAYRVPRAPRKCTVCEKYGCPGTRRRRNCPGYETWAAAQAQRP